MTEITGSFHPACLVLPEMAEAEFRELVEDIREHGLRNQIVVDEHGLILDGRHRWKACQELRKTAWQAPAGVSRMPEGLLSIERVFYGTEAEKVALVMSENITRRHLTTQQRAAIGAELATMKHGGDRKTEASTDALTDAQAAKLMNVSEPSIERAKARMRTDPEAHEQAKSGTLGRAKPKPTPNPKSQSQRCAEAQARAIKALVKHMRRVRDNFGPGTVGNAIQEYGKRASFVGIRAVDRLNAKSVSELPTDE